MASSKFVLDKLNRHPALVSVIKTTNPVKNFIVCFTHLIRKGIEGTKENIAIGIWILRNN